MRKALPILTLAGLALIASAQSAPTPPKPRPCGQPNGSYTCTLAGHVTGNAAGNVSPSTVSLFGLISFQLPLINGHFSGSGTISGTPCSIEGRIDIPNAQDPQQSYNQAYTGRLVATITDSTGLSSRLVGIQDPAFRGPPAQQQGN